MRKYFEPVDSGIIWRVQKGQVHYDNLEMSGFGADYIVTYGAGENGELYLLRHCVYPTLRTIPNDTHASYQFDIDPDRIPGVQIDGKLLVEEAAEFKIDGILTARSICRDGIEIVREFYPASKARCNIEAVTVINLSALELRLDITKEPLQVHSYGRGTKGVYVSEILCSGKKNIVLKPGDEYRFYICYCARIANEPVLQINGVVELKRRRERIGQLCDSLTLDTGNPVLDTMFRFAKLRAGESIFMTQAGLLHSPGGRHYYAATWCNDEVEYAGPWFGMTGDGSAIEASLNAYRQYMPFMSENFTAIPSSIIAEGLDIWEGAGDRGDAAMYLYGASLFLLYLGDMEAVRQLWPGIKWCAKYCDMKKSPEGVIMSDSDELEGRFATDNKANLSTSSLCYGGLRLAALLAEILGEKELWDTYTRQAEELKQAIEAYFGATLHGFDTYRYSKGFDTLRAWICLPVCMGIHERTEGTVNAMLSEYLWTEEGMLSCELGEENPSGTIWDRSTLYGFRCGFLAGKGNEIYDAFYNYCEKRLLADRVPYAVEAYPEGDKRHLSAESALFCRTITEGVLGIQPAGWRKFSFLPDLPEAMDHLYLTNIHAFGTVFDLYIDRNAYRIEINGKTVNRGKTGSRVIVDFN